MCKTLTMGMEKPIPPPLPDPEDYQVEFDGKTDPMHPYNWKLSTKYVNLSCYSELRKC
jgi:DHA1 family multidrug resistance protein-like MFS transporter